MPASGGGVGIRGDREGILTPGMLTADSVEIVSSADNSGLSVLYSGCDESSAQISNINFRRTV